MQAKRLFLCAAEKLPAFCGVNKHIPGWAVGESGWLRCAWIRVGRCSARTRDACFAFYSFGAAHAFDCLLAFVYMSAAEIFIGALVPSSTAEVSGMLTKAAVTKKSPVIIYVEVRLLILLD